MNVLGLSRAWCMKPSLDGGCGMVYRHDGSRWVKLYKRKVDRIVPIVKDKEVQRATA